MVSSKETNNIEKEFLEIKQEMNRLINMLACARYASLDFLLNEDYSKERLLQEKNAAVEFSQVIMDAAKNLSKKLDSLQPYLKPEKISKD